MPSCTLNDDVEQLLSGADTAAAKAKVFQHIKPICTQLLFQRNDPQQLTQLLGQLAAAVRDANPVGLKACYDYTIYPLLFMMESIAAVRAPASSSSSGSSSSSIGRMTITIPAMKNDRAAEAVLRSMGALLESVGALEQDQVIAVLQPVAALLTVSAGATTEEMRLQALKLIPSTLQPSRQHKQQQHYLQDSSVAPLTGVIISSCLAAADHEVAAAGTGSKAVRHAAVQALQAVVLAVGPGSQLAYFLPGVASGLMKQIMAAVPPAAGVAVTGAAASSSTTVLLLQLMTQVVIMTLGDAVIRQVPDSSSSSQQQQQQAAGLLVSSSSSVNNAGDALALLQQLSLQANGTNSTATFQLDIGTSEVASSSNPLAGSAQQQQQQQQQQRSGSGATSAGSMNFTVEQDREWLDATSSKVQTILAVALPRLLSHPQPAVRKAVAAAAADLSTHASRALWNSRQALVEILLTSANDDYQQVAEVAIAAIQQASGGITSKGVTNSSYTVASYTTAGVTRPGSSSTAGSTAAASSASMVGDLLVSLCVGLPSSVMKGETVGTAAAKRAAAAVLCAGTGVLNTLVFSKPAVVRQVCRAMLETFQLDPSTAALMLRAQAGFAGGEVTAAAAEAGSTGGSTHPAGSAEGSTNAADSTHSSTTAAGSTGGSTTADSSTGSVDSTARGTPGTTAAAGAESSSGTLTAAAAKVKASVGHPLLPRMPLSLQYLISFESYKASAGVARALGRAARMADLQGAGSGGSSSSGGSSGSSLRLLVEELLEQLTAASSPHKQQQQRRRQQETSAAGGHRLLSAAAATPAAGEWQCQTAAVVVILTELLFGASAAWQAPISSTSSGGSMQQQQQTEQVPWMDDRYDSVLIQVLSAVTQQKLWGLPTSQAAGADAAAAGEPGSTPQLPAQVLGANALLLRCLIDCVGTVARCSAAHFTSNTKLLRAALLPLLERLADPCPLVAAAAGTALASICRHSGYPLGLGQLVSANADYVVDGVCKQLRNLQQNPRAPQLLAVLLKEAGVGAQLLPLLAEPLRAALSGLSILARKQQPSYTLPFLNVLQSVAAGAAVEAAASQAVFKAQAQDCFAAATQLGLFDAQQDDFVDTDDADEVETAADAEFLQKGVDALIADASAGTAGAGAAAAAGGGDTAAAKYFKRRLQRKAAEAAGMAAAAAARASSIPAQLQQQAQQARGSTTHASEPTAAAAGVTDVDSLPALPDESKLQLPLAQLEQLELTWRRAYSAASLASSAVDAATPLLLQRNLRNAVLAAAVLSAALQALAAATDALDTEEKVFEKLVDRGADAALKPVRPTPAKLLPAVHTVWAPLLAALQDTGSVALLEQGLDLLCKMVKLAGGKFMARRFKQEAWPLLQRLLKQGPQSGATALAAAAAARSTGGGTAAAALLGVGAGPGSENPSSSSGVQHGAGVMQSALRSLEAAGSSWNMAQQGGMLAGHGHLQEDQGPVAPATIQRVQLAVLTCLQGVCSDPASAPAMQGPLVWDVCILAAPFLADSKPLALREAAAKLLVAAAQVDADAVWLVLFDLGSCYQELSQLLPSAASPPSGSSNDEASAGVNGTRGIGSPAAHLAAAVMTSVGAAELGSHSDSANGASIAVPTVQQLLPSLGVPATAGSGDDSSGLQRLLCSGESVSCGKRAAGLLSRVAQLDVAWHSLAEQQLAQLRTIRAL